jgi:hypothetical protein
MKSAFFHEAANPLRMGKKITGYGSPHPLVKLIDFLHTMKMGNEKYSFAL